MRELDRIRDNTKVPAPAHEGPSSGEVELRSVSVSVVGAGRLGTLLAVALAEAGHTVDGPLTRGELPASSSDLVLICTPDSSIAEVASQLPAGPILGHCCGSRGLEVLPVGRPGLCLHPLMTVTPAATPTTLHGAWAAVDATDDDSLQLAEALSETLGMQPVRISAEDRAVYHAAASMASNFLITIEAAAERLAASAGLPSEALVPLVRATVDNWETLGSHDALTGPVARGDLETVARQRAAVERSNPELLDLFDALCAGTTEVASPEVPA